MARITVSNQIAAPVVVVFARFTDLEGSSKRVNGIKAIEMLSTGPFGLGTRWRETREVLSHLDTAEMEVTAYEKNRTYTITHRKLAAKIDTVFTFEPFESGTRVNVELSLTGPGLPPGLLTPIEWAITGAVRQVLTQDVADLKESL
jgi:polyketide cyclase/dehydrase/lipid transport protein